jgi:hypothetical protein
MKMATVETFWAGTDFFPEDWMDLPAPAFLPELPPLPPGDYEVEIHLELSAPWCDGLTDDPLWSCLPAGETYIFSQFFTVVPGRRT